MDVRARQISDGLWEVSLPKRRSAVRGKDGVRPRRRVRAESEEDAIAKGAELFKGLDAAYLMGCTSALPDLMAAWIGHAEREGVYDAATADDYRLMAERYVAPYFAKAAADVTPIDVERFYAFLLESGGERGGGISAATVGKLNVVMRATFAFLAREGLVAANPMPSVRLPVKGQPAKRALSEREFSKVLSALEDGLSGEASGRREIERRNMLFGAYLDVFTGARVGEICAITRGRVSSSDRSVVIDRSLSTRGGLHLKQPKTAAGRRKVSLPTQAWSMLEEHYSFQATYLTDEQRDDDETPVCCTASGGFISPKRMSAFFKAFCSGVGVKLGAGEAFHVLRHTHATQLLSNGVNPKEVQSRLGHSRIETTFGYSHVLPGEDAAAAEDFGAIVSRTRSAGGFR